MIEVRTLSHKEFGRESEDPLGCVLKGEITRMHFSKGCMSLQKRRTTFVKFRSGANSIEIVSYGSQLTYCQERLRLKRAKTNKGPSIFLAAFKNDI